MRIIVTLYYLNNYSNFLLSKLVTARRTLTGSNRIFVIKNILKNKI